MNCASRAIAEQLLELFTCHYLVQTNFDADQLRCEQAIVQGYADDHREWIEDEAEEVLEVDFRMMNEVEEPRDGHVGEAQHTDEGDEIGDEVSANLQRPRCSSQERIDDIVLLAERTQSLSSTIRSNSRRWCVLHRFPGGLRSMRFRQQ